MLRSIASTVAFNQLRPLLRATALDSRSRLVSTATDESASQTNASNPLEQPQATANGETQSSESLITQLREKEKTIAELTDHYRRVLAETENIRDRSRRDVEHAHQFALQKFSKDLLEIADVLSMALNAVPSAALELAQNRDLKDLQSGLVLTRSQLLKTFDRHGVQQIDTKEADVFDPNIHHALFEVPVPDKKPGTIFQVVKSGFKLNGRVLRPAQVGVVKAVE